MAALLRSLYPLKGIEKLFEAVEEVGKPIDLTIKKPNNGQVEIVKSVTALLEQNMLTSLEIQSESSIPDEVSEKFVTALSANRSLLKLSLGYKIVPVKYNYDLFSAVLKHPTITSLGTEIRRDIDIDLFCELLATDRMEFIKANHCSFTDEDAIKIAKVISGLTNLKKIDLHLNNWGVQGIEILLKAVSENEANFAYDFHTKSTDTEHVAKLAAAIKSGQDNIYSVFDDYVFRFSNAKNAFAEYTKNSWMKKVSLLEGSDHFSPEEEACLLELLEKDLLVSMNYSTYYQIVSGEFAKNIASLLESATQLKDINLVVREGDLKSLIKLVAAASANGSINRKSFGYKNTVLVEIIRSKLEQGFTAKQIWDESYDGALSTDTKPPAKTDTEKFIEKLSEVNEVSPAEKEVHAKIVEIALELSPYLSKRMKLEKVQIVLDHNPSIMTKLGHKTVGDFFANHGDLESALQFFIKGNCWLREAEIAEKLADQQSLPPVDQQVSLISQDVHDFEITLGGDSSEDEEPV